MLSSICSIIRKASNIKGKTEHSGRGFYIMHFGDKSTSEVIANVKRGITKLRQQGLVEHEEETNESYTLVLSTQCTATGHYREFVVNKSTDLECFRFIIKW